MAELNHVEFTIAVSNELTRRGLEQKDLVKTGLSLNTIRMFMADPPSARKQGRKPSIEAGRKIGNQLGININDYMED